MARYPVTVAQFRAFAENNDAFAPGHPSSLSGTDNHPVVWVTWHEARAYCDWLTKKLRGWRQTPEALRELLLGEGGRPRWQVSLPSEAEWEKAARGPTQRIYPWDGSIEANRANYHETGLGGTSSVGCFPGGRSPFEMEDMSGNVWEWTRSLWGKEIGDPTFEYPYCPDDGREDLKAPDSVARVLRGGSFLDIDQDVRTASRNRFDPDERNFNIGFRVVLSPFSSRP